MNDESNALREHHPRCIEVMDKAAAQIESLTREKAEYREDNLMLLENCKDAQAERDTLRAELDAAKQDAERYQALLDDPESGMHLLRLLSLKKGTQDDFRRMQDSRR